MRLDFLCEMELDYAGGFFVIAPYGERQGSGYGAGGGRVVGERVIEGAPTRRAIVSPATFETDDERYRWLNDVIAVGDGTIDFQTLTLQMRYYACIGEQRPG